MARLSWPVWLVNLHSEIAVTHPSTNRARCRATALIKTNALLLHQTTTIISGKQSTNQCLPAKISYIKRCVWMCMLTISSQLCTINNCGAQSLPTGQFSIKSRLMYDKLIYQSQCWKFWYQGKIHECFGSSVEQGPSLKCMLSGFRHFSAWLNCSPRPRNDSKADKHWQIYTVFRKKTPTLIFTHNFGKCWSIFKIL